MTRLVPVLAVVLAALPARAQDGPPSDWRTWRGPFPRQQLFWTMWARRWASVLILEKERKYTISG